MAPSFLETQRFRAPWLWGPVLAVPVPPLLVLLHRREQPGAKASLVSGVLGLGLLAAMHLTVRVDDEGVQLRFFPAGRRQAGGVHPFDAGFRACSPWLNTL